MNCYERHFVYTEETISLTRSTLAHLISLPFYKLAEVKKLIRSKIVKFYNAFFLNK